MDNLIVPWQSALPITGAGEDDQLVLEDYGHLKLLISPIVLDQVVKWLKR
jgi:hypothetical protein